MSNNKFDALGSDESDVEVETNNHTVGIELDQAAFSPLDIPEGEHRLQSQYCLWYSRRGPGKQNHNFDQNLKLIGRFGSCEQFWALYSHLVKPGELATSSDFISSRWESNLCGKMKQISLVGSGL